MANGDSADGADAGASARAEHARRRASRQKRNEARFGKPLGGLVSRLDTPSHETAWARGAEGESAVAAALARGCPSGVILLHDRLAPRRQRANIDHIAVAPSGVWVIDTKRYRGKAAVTSPLFGKPALVIGGRDQTKLVGAVRAQAAGIEKLLASAGFTVGVTPALCFVDTELPLLGLPPIDGVSLSGRRGLVKRLNAPGRCSAEDVRSIAAALDGELRRATA